MTLQRLFCVQSRTRDLLVVVWVSHGLFGTFKAQFKASGSKRDTSGMVILTIHVCILLFVFQSRITYVPIFQPTVGLIQGCVLLIYLCACYNCLPMIREWARPVDKWDGPTTARNENFYLVWRVFGPGKLAGSPVVLEKRPAIILTFKPL